MEIIIEFRNQQLISNALHKIGSGIPDVISDSIYVLADDIVTDAMNYPPEPMGSTYIRTLEFMNSWDIKPNGIGVTIYNDANNDGDLYPVFVMGDDSGDGQAWMHVGNWNLIMDVAEKKAENIYDYVNNELRNLVASARL